MTGLLILAGLVAFAVSCGLIGYAIGVDTERERHRRGPETIDLVGRRA